MSEPTRDLERIRRHYQVEIQLAEKLLGATRRERVRLYTSLYDELFRLVPDHALLVKRSKPLERAKEVAYGLKILKAFLDRNSCFLEIGAGDCALSLEVAGFVKNVYALDVSKELTKNLTLPPNMTLIISDGCSVPVPAGSVDVAFSNQLMEHLHPDDALEQLGNIHAALAPGGIYLCITPNRLRGPHDISRHFDRVATGLHLKEYTVNELSRLFREAGFSAVRAYLRPTSGGKLISTFPARLCEMSIGWLPYKLRKAIASLNPMARLLGIRLVGIK